MRLRRRDVNTRKQYARFIFLYTIFMFSMDKKNAYQPIRSKFQPVRKTFSKKSPCITQLDRTRSPRVDSLFYLSYKIISRRPSHSRHEQRARFIVTHAHAHTRIGIPMSDNFSKQLLTIFT